MSKFEQMERDIISNVKLFDLSHYKYRMVVFRIIMQALQDKYMSKFRFEGDENLTTQKQKLLLKFAFKFGYSGAFNIKKAIDNNLTEPIHSDIVYDRVLKGALGEPLKILSIIKNRLIKN